MITADGMQLQFGSIDQNCSRSDIDGVKNMCSSIVVDVNGEKDPNTLGRDVFLFHVLADKILPNGVNGKTCIGPVNNGGWGCAYKVLTEGKMDY